MKRPDSTEFLVTRHGQSVADLERVCEGCLDTSPTEQGLHDARLAAEWLAANHVPHRIMCSPLMRARRTAREVARRVGVKVEVDRDLRERENGKLAGMSRAQARKKGLLRSYPPHETVPGGETLIAFRARAEGFWSRLMSESKPGQRILMVSHGQMIGMRFRCFLGLPMDDSVGLKTGDTGIHCWKVDGNSRTIVFSNSRMHLEVTASYERGKKLGAHSMANRKKRSSRTT